MLSADGRERDEAVARLHALPGMGAHLEGCAACREDYESLRDLVAADASPD